MNKRYMLRHSFAAVLGSFSHDRFYTVIVILGLAIGFAAAMLIGLYIHAEHSFERFISGYEQVYRLEMDTPGIGAELQPTVFSWSTAATQVALDFSEVEQVARLTPSSQWVGVDEAKTWERVAWVDPEFFDVLPFPVLAGDPVAALHEPSGVVLTQAMARNYFGQDAPIGETLLVQDSQDDPTVHPMVVRAVLKDTPSETHLEQFTIFASGLAAWSRLARFDRSPRPRMVWTYVRLRSGVLVDDVTAGLPAFAARHHANTSFRLEAIKDLHFTSDGAARRVGDGRAVVAGIAAVGALILVVAGINFVTLMTARGTRRTIEVGVRKVLGARRRDLVVQFIGEASIYVLLALGISMAIVKLALPPINVFLQRTIAFDLVSNPALAAAIVGTALLTGLIASLYPAAVLSSVRPASALKGGGGRLTGSAQVRQALVVVQFAVLTGLIIVAATIWRQTAFFLDNVDRLNQDHVLSFEMPCEQAFKQELSAIPGVSAVACASGQAVSDYSSSTTVRDPARETIRINATPIDVGFFEMHGLQPLAGRFFSADRGRDVVLDRNDPDPEAQPTVVLNETGVRQLGFTSPEAAVGKSLDWVRPGAAPRDSSPAFGSSQIVGVVPDFTLGTLQNTIGPTMYFVDPPNTGMILARLDESQQSETIRSIEDLWRRTGEMRPLYWEFLGDFVRQVAYRDVVVQGSVIAASTGLAIVIACLGLFAQAVFTTERQTKEIGVRKVMGASSMDVVRLLLWRFTKPVLWANVVAWPFAFWAGSHWLEGFAYRVSLPLWLFFAASASALLIAWATVGTQSWRAAQAKPAATLRYE